MCLSPGRPICASSVSGLVEAEQPRLDVHHCVQDERRASADGNLLLDELEMAMDELPVEQREVFVAHELEGRSFKEMAAETGVGVNTLLSRKRYAVLHLRKRLRGVYDELAKG